MKKYFLAFFSTLIIAAGASAQVFKRTDKMPSFFVPNGALTTGQQKEKLPPISSMQYRGKQAPVVIEMQKQQQLQAAKAQQITDNQTAENPANPEKLGVNQGSLKDTDISPKLVNQSPTTETSLTQSETQQSTEKVSMIDKGFKQIIAEHHRDIKDISLGETVNNPRLAKVISDYKNQEHAI